MKIRETMAADVPDALAVKRQSTGPAEKEPNEIRYGLPLYGDGTGEDHIGGSWKPGMRFGPTIDFGGPNGLLIGLTGNFLSLEAASPTIGTEYSKDAFQAIKDNEIDRQSSKSTNSFPTKGLQNTGDRGRVFYSRSTKSSIEVIDNNGGGQVSHKRATDTIP